MTTELNTTNFDSFIAEGTVLVDFWAPWCGPCRMLSPLVEKVAEATPALKVGKLNVDDYSDLAARYNVMSIPLLLLFKDGRLVDKSVGLVPQAQLEAFIAKAL